MSSEVKQYLCQQHVLFAVYNTVHNRSAFSV